MATVVQHQQLSRQGSIKLLHRRLRAVAARGAPAPPLGLGRVARGGAAAAAAALTPLLPTLAHAGIAAPAAGQALLTISATIPRQWFAGFVSTILA